MQWIEENCLLLLRMFISYSILDILILRWISYIKSMNQKFKYIERKDNMIVDML